eukprot:gene5877-19013_t
MPTLQPLYLQPIHLCIAQVCPDSAKVQLNSGILQRRKNNYPAALNHFERAREVEPGYCEPTYWDGLALQRWGQILVRPEVNRLEEGCETLQSAALIYAVEGRNAPATTICLDACINAIKGDGDNADGVHQIMYPVKKGPDDLTLYQVYSCAMARRPVYIQIGNYGPKARMTRKAIYKYLKFLERHPYCRRGASQDERQEGQHTAHMRLVHSRTVNHSSHRLVHSIQSQDPEDPWLQQEWGEILAGTGRTQEAAMHLSVAGTMLGIHAQTLVAAAKSAGQEGGGEKTERQAVMSVSQPERPATLFEAYHNAGKSYDRSIELHPHNVCDLLLHAADSHLKALAVAPSIQAEESASQLAERAVQRANSLLQLCSDKPEYKDYMKALSH